MRAPTHILYGFLLGVLLAPLSSLHQWFFVALCVLGSLIPDIDHASSRLGRYFKLFNWAVEHRGPTHTVWFVVLAGALVYYIYPVAALPLVVGIASHLILDMLTPKGVRLCYPFGPSFHILKLKFIGEIVVFVLGVLAFLALYGA